MNTTNERKQKAEELRQRPMHERKGGKRAAAP